MAGHCRPARGAERPHHRPRRPTAVAAVSGRRPEPISEEAAVDDPQPVVVIYNPVKNIDVPVFTRMVEDMAADAGYVDVRFVETTIEHPGDDQAGQAAADGAGLVIAAGGDGTVRAVAAGLAGSSVALGIVALGTGNLLARNLDLPINSPGEMVRTALTGWHPLHGPGLPRGRSADRG